MHKMLQNLSCHIPVLLGLSATARLKRSGRVLTDRVPIRLLKTHFQQQVGWGTRLGGDRPDTRRHFLATTSAAFCLPTIFLPRTNFYPDNTTTGALHHYFLPPLTICIVRLSEKMMRRQECIEFLLSAEGRFRKMCSMLQKVLGKAV